MEFQFESLREFFWMEGHGPYVWSAYAITFAGLCGLGLKVKMDRKNFYKIQASIVKRNRQIAVES